MGGHHKKYFCRRCLNSYTCEIMLMIHKPKCEKYDITIIRTSSEPHLHRKDHFNKNPLYFGIYADLKYAEADNEIDNSSVGNKTTNIYKQNPIFDGYHIDSELDVLKSDYYKSPLRYDNLDWFVNEVKKLKKTAFYFKNNKKDTITTDEDEENIEKIEFLDVLRKTLNLIKFEITFFLLADTGFQLI